MKRMLEELWYGNIDPSNDCYASSKETKELMGYIADHHRALSETLTDKQKELLERLDDCSTELSEHTERDLFVYAFRLGARIAFEIMTFDVE